MQITWQSFLGGVFAPILTIMLCAGLALCFVLWMGRTSDELDD